MWPRPSPCTVNSTFMEFYQLKVPLQILDQGSAVLHPIAAVQVEHAADLADFRPVDVAANDSINLTFASELDHGLFVVRDVFHGRLGLEFDIGSKRPVTKTQTSPNTVHPHVEIKDALVKR